jgi:hypothetical protein
MVSPRFMITNRASCPVSQMEAPVEDIPYRFQPYPVREEAH